MRIISNNILMVFVLSSIDVSSQLTEYTSNLNGSVKKVIDTEPSYNGVRTIVRDYNLDGFLKLESIYSGNDFNKDSLQSKNKFNYKLDRKNRISEILIANQKKEKRKKIIKYKASFYTINTLWRENLKWKSYDGICRFTNNHKEYKIKVALEGGMFYEHYKWNKDKTQLLQMRFETNEQDWDEYIVNYTYNGDGLLVNKENKVKVDSLFDIQFHIDSSGGIQNEYIFNSTKSDSYNIEYRYNNYNHCIEEIMINHDGSICRKTYHFQYDDKKNWTEKKEYIDGVLINTYVREIIYFL